MKNNTNNLNMAEEVKSQLPSMAENAKQRQAVESRVNLNPSTVRISSPGKSDPWGIEEMRLAIRDIADIGERVMLNFLMLGEIGRAIRERNDNVVADHIEIGLREKQLTPEVKSLFKTWGFEETKYGYTYNYTPPLKWGIKIPVKIRVIKRSYPFFDNPDMGYYFTDTFNVPNPFDKYWKVRALIK